MLWHVAQIEVKRVRQTPSLHLALPFIHIFFIWGGGGGGCEIIGWGYKNEALAVLYDIIRV